MRSGKRRSEYRSDQSDQSDPSDLPSALRSPPSDLRSEAPEEPGPVNEDCADDKDPQEARRGDRHFAGTPARRGSEKDRSGIRVGANTDEDGAKPERIDQECVLELASEKVTQAACNAAGGTSPARELMKETDWGRQTREQPESSEKSGGDGDNKPDQLMIEFTWA